MGILDKLTGSGKPAISPNATFRLTEQGREKIQEFGGDDKSRILVALETHGTMNIAEIASASGLSRGQVERAVPKLTRANYIQYTGAVTEDA